MRSTTEAEAVAGRGLAGDRYFESEKPNDPEREITLIESEAVEAVNRDENLVLEASETRRNLLTRGVALNHLVGREFRVGSVLLRGVELCEPCSRLEKLTRPRMMKALLHRGGLRASILEGGTLREGDRIEAVES